MERTLKQKIILSSILFILGASTAFNSYFIFLAHEKNVSINPIKIKTEPKQLTLPVVNFQTPFNDSLAITQTSFSNKICDITQYGAVGDGQAMNTRAFDSAIDDCADSGGGEVLVPDGKWLTGPIHLKSNINLHVNGNAEILFSKNLNDYLPVVFSRFEGIEYYNYSPAIYAKDCTNVAITGEGKINGQAEDSWWKMNGIFSMDPVYKLYDMGNQNVPVDQRVFGTEDGLRPTFVEFVNCDSVLISDVTLVNGSMWTTHILYSKNVTVKGIDIQTENGRSTDGIVIDSSANVLVEDSFLSTGDDSIVIKSGRDTDGLRVNRPSENIIIRNNNIKNTHAGVAIGSEISGGVNNVFVDNLFVDNSQFGFRIKSALGRYGFVKNIWAQNIRIQYASEAAFQINSTYEKNLLTDGASDFENIYLSNIDCDEAGTAFVFKGFPDKPIQNISLNNITISSKGAATITNSKNISIGKIKIKTAKKPAIVLDANSEVNYEVNYEKTTN
jgi:polygalacturonase